MTKRHRRSGVTLVELVVAIALSAMLLLALVGVLRGMSQQNKLAAKMEQPIWPDQFIELVYRDLLSADALWQEQGTIWFRGDAPRYGASVGGTRDIGYRCIQLGSGQSVLTRIDAESTRIVALGPDVVSLERLDASGDPQPLPPAPGPVPGQVRLWVKQDSQLEPLLVRDLVAR